MSYKFLYTNIEAINRRLGNRLQLTDAATLPLGMGKQSVDTELVEQVAEQVEDSINYVLAQIYQLPLQNRHPVLAEIAEKLICAELYSTFFQATQVPELGGDAGYGGKLRKEAMDRLQFLAYGYNVYIPGVPPVVPMPGMTPQPVVLPGERLAYQQPDTITRNVTVTSSRKFDGDKGAEIIWSSNPRFPVGKPPRAMGSENPFV